MGTTRFWLLLIVAQVIVLICLAALGPTTATTPALRYTGFVCLAGIFGCIPPLFIKLMIAAQIRVGNEHLSLVQSLRSNELRITLGVWLLIIVALVIALPRMKQDFAENARADSAFAAVMKDPEKRARLDSAMEAHRESAAKIIGPATVSRPARFLERDASVDTTPVLTPGAGSKTRTAILDALRDRLKMKGRFRVDHIRTYNNWAFVRATEVVELDKGELQETDLTVSALLELPANSTIGAWRIVELWTLPDNEKLSMADFMRSVRARQRSNHLPNALFPDDLSGTPQ